MEQERRNRILEIIDSEDITTQDDLLARLRADGYDVTQATVSRDMKKLRLVKTANGHGKYRYTVSQEGGSTGSLNTRSIIRETVIGIDYAENLVVVKTFSGMAQAAAAAIDAMKMPALVGSVAGDDTVLLVMRTKEDAQSFLESYNKMTE